MRVGRCEQYTQLGENTGKGVERKRVANGVGEPEGIKEIKIDYKKVSKFTKEIEKYMLMPEFEEDMGFSTQTVQQLVQKLGKLVEDKSSANSVISTLVQIKDISAGRNTYFAMNIHNIVAEILMKK